MNCSDCNTTLFGLDLLVTFSLSGVVTAAKKGLEEEGEDHGHHQKDQATSDHGRRPAEDVVKLALPAPPDELFGQ